MVLRVCITSMRCWSYFRGNKLLLKLPSYLQLEAGGVRRQKRRKVIEREQKIKILADELANGNRDIDSYISAIRHCCFL